MRKINRAALARAAKLKRNPGISKPGTGAVHRKRSTRTSFPVEQVAKLWNDGKSVADIARAVNRYDDNAKDPTASFRGSLNLARKKGLLKIGFRQKVKK